MIKSFTIKNYKSYGSNGVEFSFKNTRNNTYRPINLFYGANGSGKSSIKTFLQEKYNIDIPSRTDILWQTPEVLLCFDENFVKERFKEKGTLSITTGKADDNEKQNAEDAIIRYNAFKNTLIQRDVTGQIKVTNNSEFYYKDDFDEKIINSPYRDFFSLEKELLKDLDKKDLSEENRNRLNSYYNDFKNQIDSDCAVTETANCFLKQLCDFNIHITNSFPELLTCSMPCFYLYFSLTSRLDEVRDNSSNPKNNRDNNTFFEDVNENKINNVFNSLISRVKNKIDRIVERLNLLKQIKDPQYVAEKINKYLELYGFFDIKLEVNTEEGIINRKKNMFNLRVKRTFSNSTKNMFETLSEGEKHLLAFLYFYECCIGFDDLNDALHPKDKIILIDDPITSMDSNSIFLVSNLICDLFELDNQTRNDAYTLSKPYINQGIVLTHNAFFLRELCYRINFAPSKMTLKYIYKICVEQNGETKYQSCVDDWDGFKDDYAILWDTFFTLTDPNRNVSENGITPLPNVMLPNICRRILESYGKFEGLDYSDSASNIIRNLRNYRAYSSNELTNDEIRVYNSFIAIFNTGSHYISPTDDLFASNMGIDYLKIFETLFSILDPQHYKLHKEKYLSRP